MAYTPRTASSANSVAKTIAGEAAAGSMAMKTGNMRKSTGATVNVGRSVKCAAASCATMNAASHASMTGHASCRYEMLDQKMKTRMVATPATRCSHPGPRIAPMIPSPIVISSRNPNSRLYRVPYAGTAAANSANASGSAAPMIAA